MKTILEWFGEEVRFETRAGFFVFIIAVQMVKTLIDEIVKYFSKLV